MAVPHAPSPRTAKYRGMRNAEMAKKESAKGTGDKADAKGRKRRKRADRRGEFWKERFVEDKRRGRTVDKVIIPFERRPNAGRDDPGKKQSAHEVSPTLQGDWTRQHRV